MGTPHPGPLAQATPAKVNKGRVGLWGALARSWSPDSHPSPDFQPRPSLAASPLSPPGRLSPPAFAHTVSPSSSPLPPPWVCWSLVHLLQEALPDCPAHSNPCFLQHMAIVKLGFDYVLNHHLQSNLHFPWHLSCPWSPWTSQEPFGASGSCCHFADGDQEVRKGPEFMWGCSCTNG